MVYNFQQIVFCFFCRRSEFEVQSVHNRIKTRGNNVHCSVYNKFLRSRRLSCYYLQHSNPATHGIFKNQEWNCEDPPMFYIELTLSCSGFFFNVSDRRLSCYCLQHSNPATQGIFKNQECTCEDPPMCCIEVTLSCSGLGFFLMLLIMYFSKWLQTHGIQNYSGKLSMIQYGIIWHIKEYSGNVV